MSDDKTTTEDNQPEKAPVEPAMPEAPAEGSESTVSEEPKEADVPTATEDTPVEVPAEENAPATEEATDDEPVKTENVVVKELPNRNVEPGMLVRVHEVIKDINAKGEERERVQIFEGTVLGLSGEGIGRTMTVRKISGGFGVEKIYPLASPHVQKIEVVKKYRVRRSKLWYLRRDKKKRKMYEDSRKRAI